MMRLGRPIPVHPLLLSAFPVLALYASGFGQSAPSDIILPLAAAILLALAAVLLGWLVTRDVRRGAVLASVFVVAFFGYGHVLQLGTGIWHAGHRVLAVGLFLLEALVVAVAGVALRRTDRRLTMLTSVVNIIALALLLSTGVRIAYLETVHSASRDRQNADRSDPVMPAWTRPTPPPDVYYIILDRYPDAQVLRDVYGVDNTPFLRSLRQRGFRVAENSRCNYARTDMSLMSSLNLQYLDALDLPNDPAALQRSLYAGLQDYALWRVLRRTGYCFYHLGTWWRGTSNNRFADVNVNVSNLTEFQRVLLGTTALHPVLAAFGLTAYREQWIRERHKLAMLKKLAGLPGPKFVFAHFLLPHEPYVFREDGSYAGSVYPSGRTGFAGQLSYLNTQITEVVDSLLSASSQPPVVVLQADEGPRPGLNFPVADTLRATAYHYSILCACYLPQGREHVYDSITPVNLFRLVLRTVYGADLDLLPDRSYEYRDGHFEDITDSLAVWVNRT